MLDKALATAEDVLGEIGAPGAVVALRSRGDHLLAFSVGSASPDGRTPMSTDSRFYAFSATKTILSCLALRCAEEKRLDLDAPIHLEDLIRNAWRSPSPDFEPMSARQLLSHTAGIPDYGYLQSYGDAVKAQPGNPWDRSDFVRETLPQGQRFAPGKGWLYSNVGYMLLGQFIEDACQGTLQGLLDDYLREHSLQVATQMPAPGSLAPGWSTYFGDIRDATLIYHPGWVAHRTIICTTGGLAACFDAILDGPLLAKESWAKMRSGTPVPGQFPPDLAPEYGLGLMSENTGWGRAYGHNGEGPGFSVAAWNIPVGKHGVTGAAMVNRDFPGAAQRVLLAVVTSISAELGG